MEDIGFKEHFEKIYLPYLAGAGERVGLHTVPLVTSEGQFLAVDRLVLSASFPFFRDLSSSAISTAIIAPDFSMDSLLQLGSLIYTGR